MPRGMPRPSFAALVIPAKAGIHPRSSSDLGFTQKMDPRFREEDGNSEEERKRLQGANTLAQACTLNQARHFP